MALCFTSQSLRAATFGLFTYTENTTSITITDYPTTATGAVVVPATIVGKPVSSIGTDCFYGCNGLTSVALPSSVTSIGFRAFLRCSSLSSITLPSSLTRIENYAFAYCISLPSVTIPASVTSIGAGSFAGCTILAFIAVPASNAAFSSLGGVLFNKNQTTLIQYPEANGTSYNIPNSVTRIENGAFLLCSSLANILIPHSVTNIGDEAFDSCSSLSSIAIPNSVVRIEGYRTFGHCTSLSSVTIPNSVTSIGSETFSGCSNLEGITIPSSVREIGSAPFANCGSLLAISVDPLNPAYSSLEGVLFNKIQTELIQYPDGKGSSYTIPNSVTSIAKGAFFDSSTLTNVVIPNNVTDIGISAFAFCENLKIAWFLGSAPAMGTSAYDGLASGFTSYFFLGASGFTTPTWQGYPAISLPQLFTSSGSITIPSSGTIGNASPYPSTINVSGVPPGSTTLRVKLNGLTHTYPDDLDVFLVAPSGAVAALMSDCGGSGPLSNVNLIFGDSATASLPDGPAITPGTYRPTNIGTTEALPPGGVGTIGTNLAALTNGAINGTWKLFVTDDSGGDSGSISSWTLELTTIPSDGAGPTGGTMSFSPSSPFNPSTSISVNFTGWTDASPPLSYAVLVNGTLVSAQGSSSTRNITAPVTGGTYSLVGRIYDSLNNMREVTQSFSVTTPQQSFTNTMTLAGLTGANAEATATPHNDGVKNLLKYAFNMNLSGPDTRRLVSGTGIQGLPAITSTRSGATTTLRVEFIRRIGSGLVYTPKRSSDLSGASWVTLTDIPTVTPINAAWERVLYEEPLTTATHPKCFGVVEVSLP